MKLNIPEKYKKVLFRGLFIVALAALVISAVMLIITLFPPYENFDEYKNIESQTEQISSGEAELPINPINFDVLQTENPDICAWIKIDGAEIDYPILRSGEGTSENFYLDHDYLGNPKKAGSIYIQRLNSIDFSDPNTVIYGHNMKNGSMFGRLKKFRNADFFNQNQTITVYTPGHILSYKIFSAFIYDNRHILNSFDFQNDISFAEFLSECTNPKSRTRNLRADVIPTTSDRIITLSTCVGVDTQRYLITALLVDDTLTK